jgi:starch synthase (maltosyl-transferring)
MFKWEYKMENQKIARVVIENVKPEIEEGIYPVKRVVGERVSVRADIFAEGHDIVCAQLQHRFFNDRSWKRIPMMHLGNDLWEGSFRVDRMGSYLYTVRGWVSVYRTWCEDIVKKRDAGLDIAVDLEIGVDLLEKTLESASSADAGILESVIDRSGLKNKREKIISLLLDEKTRDLMDKYVSEDIVTSYKRELCVTVERKKALFSTWYEVFPRSCAADGREHGTFKDCEKILPDIAEMGFDVVYLPPIHPIGKSNRKGKNNLASEEAGDPGSPWAIGSKEGGHKAIHPELGKMADLKRFMERAKKLGLDVAIDLAFQCSPDHPWVKEHPEWFKWRPDGTVQYAENPPKKYEDIIPINFGTTEWQSLWEELKSVVLFWIDHGISIFRVDNPHTKPFAFWEWLIKEIRNAHPQVIFLAEAFTRPKVMYRLAKLGFTQSYTYFTWRNTKHELMEYLTELTSSEVKEFFRPNFWPNTPDILPQYLQFGGRAAFIVRLVLAATLSSNYGIYGPAYELCTSEALLGREEYLDSEKYEIKRWDRESRGNIKEIIARVNKIRKENSALRSTNNLRFYNIENDALIFYAKSSEDLGNTIFVAANLDPFHPQAGRVRIPLRELNLEADQPFLVHDLLSDEKYIWQGEYNYIALNPLVLPVHVFALKRYVRHEQDFDYFM